MLAFFLFYLKTLLKSADFCTKTSLCLAEWNDKTKNFALLWSMQILVLFLHTPLAHSRVWHHWCAWLVSTVLDVNRTFSMYLNRYRKKRTGYIFTGHILLNDQRTVYHLFCRILAFSCKLFIFLPCYSFRTITQGSTAVPAGHGICHRIPS